MPQTIILALSEASHSNHVTLVLEMRVVSACSRICQVKDKFVLTNSNAGSHASRHEDNLNNQRDTKGKQLLLIKLENQILANV